MENNKKNDFIRASLGIATAQICQSLGWHSVQRSSHDILTDVLERYLSQVSKTAAVISQTCCRTVPNLDDISLAFNQLGIHIQELQDYVQQVESSPAVKPSAAVPLETDKPKCLLNFSGEDFLPPLVDITIKEEIKSEDVEQEENDATNVNEDSGKTDRPKNLSFRTDSVESPPYSPLEPKSLNLNAFHSVDLTRPDLKVTTPKGYTPTLTTPSLVSGIASMTNSVAKSSPSRKVTPPNKSSKSDTKTTKKEKKEKKESHSKKNDKTHHLSAKTFSPPCVKSERSSHTPSPKLSKPSKSPVPVISPKEKEREKEKEKEKELELTKEREKEKELELAKEREKEKERELAKEREREKEREIEMEQLEKEKDDLEDNSSTTLLNPSSPPPSPPPFLLHKRDSPSLLFSPPRMRIASYQSDKKKPSKEKSKDHSHKKDSKDDKKSSKQHKKKSPALSSPASSVGSLKSPPSIIKSPSPPKLSQPIIKQEKSSNKTVIFPSDFSSSDKNSPSQDQGNSQDERDGGITVKHENDEKPSLNDSPTSSMPLLHKRDIKVEPSVDQRHPTDISENEIDVTTLSQGEETNYTETFQPNMFFPLKFEEKKKKKKKKSDKDRDEKNKKKENRDKKDRKRKHENSSSATAIPKLTLKMGSEMIKDEEPPSKMSNQRSDSPFTSVESTLTPSASEIIKKKKEKKHKQKDKDKDNDKDKDKERDDSKGSFYVETLANTSNPYGGEIYYCPGCGLPDDGSPMIGCDSCDGWYHWPCVNIVEEPAEDEKWYCPNCTGSTSAKKKKKKKKRDDF